jgi:hypothetical protein
MSQINRAYFGISNTPSTSGALTVSSAVSGPYQTLGASHDGLSFDVSIVDGSAWEVRTGCVYTHSGTSLSRGTLEASSTGSAIDLTSAAQVMVTSTAARFNLLAIAMQSVIPGGRLTLESGVPVSTTDQTAKTTIYYTPYVHNTVPLWNGSIWVPTTFAETSLALGTLTSGKPYDVFGYLSSGVLALELLAWTDGSTRATAVTLQDGRYCKSGDKTRLLLGTFYTVSTTTTEDSVANRFVSNVYNRVAKNLTYTSLDAGHTYSTKTVRAYNNTSASRVSMVCAVEAPAIGTVAANIHNSTTGDPVDIFVGVDSTSSSSDDFSAESNSNTNIIRAAASGATLLAAGKHDIYMLQRGPSAGTGYYSYGLIRGAVQC